jgi:hypothetical protein
VPAVVDPTGRKRFSITRRSSASLYVVVLARRASAWAVSSGVSVPPSISSASCISAAVIWSKKATGSGTALMPAVTVAEVVS